MTIINIIKTATVEVTRKKAESYLVGEGVLTKEEAGEMSDEMLAVIYGENIDDSALGFDRDVITCGE